MKDSKLRIKGIGNLIIHEEIESGKDYIIPVRCALDKVEIPAAEGEEANPRTYIVKAINVEDIIKIGDSKPVKVQKGSTPSQILRYSINDWAKRLRIEDEDSFYEEKMRKLVEYVNQKDI